MIYFVNSTHHGLPDRSSGECQSSIDFDLRFDVSDNYFFCVRGDDDGLKTVSNVLSIRNKHRFKRAFLISRNLNFCHSVSLAELSLFIPIIGVFLSGFPVVLTAMLIFISPSMIISVSRF